MKYLSVKEFREKGYLQELNRRFLHPLGLALEVKIFEDGREVISGIWDCRENKKGIYYDIKNSNNERKERFKKNKEYIDSEIEKRRVEREKLLGDLIEPIE